MSKKELIKKALSKGTGGLFITDAEFEKFCAENKCEWLNGYPLATLIINKLNEYCLEQDPNRLGLPCMDELAMAEMEELVVKILNK